jgi:hypothetical protein
MYGGVEVKLNNSFGDECEGQLHPEAVLLPRK